MNINTWFYPTIIFAVMLYYLSLKLWQINTGRLFRYIFIVVSIILFIPAFLYIFYYLHWMDDAVWYYQFRALPGTELLAAGAGVLSGVIGSVCKKYKLLSNSFILCLLILGIFIPYCKSALFPVDYSSLENKWRNGFCLQSSNSTCGPASAATILGCYGIPVTEAELAKECYSYIGGTEIWYIARALEKRGFRCRFAIDKKDEIHDFPYPCIAGINIGAGHFITIIDKEQDAYIIGDPLVGRKSIKTEDVFRRINFTGFFLVVSN